MTDFGEKHPARKEAESGIAETPGHVEKRKTLKDLKVGDSADIVDFLQQSDAVRKIEAMGLRKGRKIVIMQKLGRGILVKTSNTRIAITSDLAKQIEVK